MGVFHLAEHFISINGEGQAAGELAVFLRFTGCNLHCSYCDTAWANVPDAPYTLMTTEDLCQFVKESGIHNVTLTGGEPLLQPDIAELIVSLGALGCRVEIETNGSIPLEEFARLCPRPCFTADYKLPGSSMEAAMQTAHFNLLTMQDTIKFVAGSVTDLERTLEIIQSYDLTERCKVYLSPVFGQITPAEMVEFMKTHRMNGVRLQLQLHKHIWQPDARGV